MWNTKQTFSHTESRVNYKIRNEQLLKWGGHSASFDKAKYHAEGNPDSLRVATKSCTKQNYKYDNK